jgi:Cu-processing system ATP-binding protein
MRDGREPAVTVRLDGVAKSFGRQDALRGVDLALHAGECVGLVGHNGAGKSTMIKLMLGLLRPSAGRVEVLGEPAGAARARLEVGYLPESVALYPAMTGEETLAFYARLKRQKTDRNAELLERVGIAHAARRRVGTYSKGMRQRLALAQALLGRPRVLLLDEPTTGLDPALRQGFYDIVRGLRDDGATVLLSSHALAELAGQVDRVVVMNRGRKAADGTLAELRRLAGMPVRIRVLLAEAAQRAVNDRGRADPWEGWRRTGERMLELACEETDKVEAIRSLAHLPGVIDDIEIQQPTLDDLYARFLVRSEAER